MKFSSLSLLAIAPVSSKVTFGENCPTSGIQTMVEFDKSRYVGTWYVWKDDHPFSSPCQTATYKALPNGDISVSNRGWFWWFFFSYFSVNGSARCPYTNGKCWVTFNLTGDRADISKGLGNYNVLKTDYDNYTIVYDCVNTWYGAK